MSDIKKITFALTACNRPDLLEITMDSFFEFNTYPIERFIISEDSGIMGVNDHLIEKYKDRNIEWIINPRPLGQIQTIDNMYSLINTEYIFHCEEDWRFTDYSFIEKSLNIMEKEPKILQVWLRAHNDTNGHPIIPDNNEYDIMMLHWANGWGGFSFNPGLRRLSDYKLIERYQLTPKEGSALTEFKTSIKYTNLGYRAAILKTKHVEHIGWNRHVKN